MTAFWQGTVLSASPALYPQIIYTQKLGNF
jgi:hypothetical protein